MKYTKPPLNFRDQAKLLISRGLEAHEDTLSWYLSMVNYYRLSAYWYQFRQLNPISGVETFIQGTKFDDIWARYVFDRQLRLHIMSGIDCIEIGLLRTRFVECFSLQYGPFGYSDEMNFDPKINHKQMMGDIHADIKKSKERFIEYYQQKYSSEKELPMWMVVELMTFGHVAYAYKYSHRIIKKQIADEFGLKMKVMESWVHTLLYLRNSCAHHARIWNRIIPVRPLIPSRKCDSSWYEPVRVDNTRIFASLIIIKRMIQVIDPKSCWGNILEEILSKSPDIPISQMGFPEAWCELPVWKQGSVRDKVI